ncbi:MAG: BamA/TamA family outer membrane protein [Ferruginibacter sp.]
MPDTFLNHTRSYFRFIPVFVLIISFFSCLPPIVSKAPKGKPYLVENSFKVKGGNFTNIERTTLEQRMKGQLDDSSTVKTKDVLFILHFIKRPPAYDSGYSAISAANMKASMFHLGYYNAKVTFTADTIKREVHVHYLVEAGKPTLIDTVSYRLRKPDLQEIAVNSKDEALLKKYDPITKNAVISEINRLVDSFRNNGYYKFTASELRVRGDTTIEALTNISDDPFEQLRLLAEAQQKADSPQVRIAVVLNPPKDSTKLSKFYINKIYVLSDFRPRDEFYDSSSTIQRDTRNFIHRYHQRLFRTSFLARNITFRSGDLYNSDQYYKTLSNLSRAGVWQSINMRVVEVPDSAHKIDIIIELIPAKKFGFEAALELSYSANSNASTVLGGNLFGVSGNISLTNRNVGREAIRMTHKIRAGIELNTNNSSAGKDLINSNELSYTNSIVYPRLIFPGFLKRFIKPFASINDSVRLSLLPKGESFINTSLSYNNRLNLFNLQSINLNFGWTWMDKHNLKWEIRPFNLGFSKLYNQTDSFTTILQQNPFLNYAFNTAYVVGMGASFSNEYHNPFHRRSLSKVRSIRINVEESGLTWGNLGILKKYLRRYVKVDLLEYKYTVSYQKTALAFKFFAGIGIPLLGSDTNRTLPFFKQYIGGGSNSMRGWPIRGIGIGGQPLAPFNTSALFNDRTGDMQLEGNMEYRYDIIRIIPNTLTLRGALFVDAGNIWNLRYNKTDGTEDSAQFKFKNIYKQLGVSAGTGLRLDFNNFLIRFDFGFRFKRPELFYINDGWKAPNLGFDDVLAKIFSRNQRQWRYENFNFSIGINYPF